MKQWINYLTNLTMRRESIHCPPPGAQIRMECMHYATFIESANVNRESRAKCVERSEVRYGKVRFGCFVVVKILAAPSASVVHI